MNLFVRLVNYTMIFQIVVFVGFIIGLLLQCRPIAYNWIDVPGGYCGLDVETSFIISGTINLIVDIWLVVLPIMPVWKLQHVSKMKRFGINAMFGLGVLWVYAFISIPQRIKLMFVNSGSVYLWAFASN